MTVAQNKKPNWIKLALALLFLGVIGGIAWRSVNGNYNASTSASTVAPVVPAVNENVPAQEANTQTAANSRPTFNISKCQIDAADQYNSAMRKVDEDTEKGTVNPVDSYNTTKALETARQSVLEACQRNCEFMLTHGGSCS
jgi:hypothetical protein